MHRLFATILFGLLISVSPASAQYTPGSFMYFDHLANNTAVNIGLLGKQKYHDDDEEEDKQEVLKRLLEKSKKQPARTVRPTDFVFPVSQPARTATLNAIVDGLSKDNPAGRRELQAALIDQNIFAVLDTAIQKYGLRTNNLADAYTLYWISSWEAAHNSMQGESSPAQVKAVKAQVVDFLSNVDALHTMKVADKQQLSDTLLVNAVLLEMIGESAKADPQFQELRSQAGRSGAAAFGLIVDGVTLTESGFAAS